MNEQTKKPMRAGLPEPDGHLQNQLPEESGIRKRAFHMAGRTGAADSGRARLFGALCADFTTAKEEINVIDPEIMAFGLRILDWCSRMWPYALMTPEQLANKKYWRKWKDAKNCVEQPGGNAAPDGDRLRDHDGAGHRAVGRESKENFGTGTFDIGEKGIRNAAPRQI